MYFFGRRRRGQRGGGEGAKLMTCFRAKNTIAEKKTHLRMGRSAHVTEENSERTVIPMKKKKVYSCRVCMRPCSVTGFQIEKIFSEIRRNPQSSAGFLIALSIMTISLSPRGLGEWAQLLKILIIMRDIERCTYLWNARLAPPPQKLR